VRNCITKYIVFSWSLMLITGTSVSQGTISGVVVDSSSRQPLPAVVVTAVQANYTYLTNSNGYFEMFLDAGTYDLKFNIMGYTTRQFTIVVENNHYQRLDTIALSQATIGLKEVKIIAAEVVQRKTPVPVTNINSLTIERYLGDQPYAEIMKVAPGVYATREGGGSGDASVNIRGFKQENVGLLLNGIPINSVENGLVFWNNWNGLSDVTEQLQVQRGLGASNVAQNSIGGTINIITKTTQVEKGGSFKYGLTSYGNSKSTILLSTGKLKNGLAITFQGSRFSGPGYVDATYVNGWAYFLTISKDFGKDHKLVLTALGNTDKHGQRNFRLSNEEHEQYGRKYNKDWGSYNGEINNASENFYHKPQISLNHYWNVSDQSFLATAAYFSFGNGGGKWTDTFGDNPWIFSYYNPSGQIDWPAIYEINSSNIDTFTLDNRMDTSGYSINIQTDFLADHIWTGLLSTLHHDFNSNFKLIAGFHGRYFKSNLQQKVRDLLGGQFYIDDYAYAIDGVAGRNQIKHVGDIVKVDNSAFVNYLSAFTQLEYSRGSLNGFISGTVNNTWYQREDRYNYINETRSEIISKFGFDVKLGANYNIDEFNNIYLNAGYYSKAPYFKFVFGNFTNTPTSNLKNEKVSAIELGYGLNFKHTRLRFNTYYTQWADKSVLSNEYNQFEDPTMIQGLDAQHMGLELEITQQFNNVLEMRAFAAIGNWKWRNNVTAYLFNDQNTIIDTIQVYADGLYVGDAPQTQIGISAKVKILQLFDLSADWIYYDRMYADFSPETRTDPDDISQSYRLPSYHVLDLHLGYAFQIGSVDFYAHTSCYNALNSDYILRGIDGEQHNLESFSGFWAFGRNFNFSMKLIF